MKKIDKLVFSSFIGTFILTFVVIVFILLTVQMMRYVDEIFGKNLDFSVLGELVFHFSVFQIPMALPLSVMLASLMTFGNLGEHFELTAIKGAGISLTRAIAPIFGFVIILTGLAFYLFNYFVPQSALKAYKILYDIRQTKPALDIKEGIFYGGIPDYRIKVEEKFPDERTLRGLIIFHHPNRSGNQKIIVADSGQMYTIMDDRYLKFVLFDGYHFSEGEHNSSSGKTPDIEEVAPFTRTYFDRSEMVFNLESFDMSETDEGLFSSHRFTRNFNQLSSDVDSLTREIHNARYVSYSSVKGYYKYHFMKDSLKIPQILEDAKHRKDSIDKSNREKEDEIRDAEIARSKALLDEQEMDSVGLTNVGGMIKGNSPDPEKIAKPVNSKTTKVKNIEGIDMNSKEPPKIDRGEDVGKKVRELAQAPVLPLEPELDKKSLKLIQDEALRIRLTEEYMADTSKLQALKETIEARIKTRKAEARILKTAVNSVRQARQRFGSQKRTMENLQVSYAVFDIQWHKMIANSFSCLVMFLIGAPLGAIIKRGGIGFPVIISIVFFIIFYVLSMTGEKQVKQGHIDPVLGAWIANGLLFPVGLFFLKQAKNDARLFESDFYRVAFSKIRSWIKKKSEDS